MKRALLRMIMSLSSTRAGGWFFITVAPHIDRLLMRISGGRLNTGSGLVPILVLLPFFLAVISLMVWLPSSSSAMGTPIAWSWIVLPVVVVAVALLVAGNIGASFKQANGLLSTVGICPCSHD